MVLNAGRNEEYSLTGRRERGASLVRRKRGSGLVYVCFSGSITIINGGTAVTGKKEKSLG